MERPFTDIVVPLDGSPAAERALVPAVELARRTGAPLRVLSRALPDEKEELTEYLAGIADRHAAVVDIDTEVVDRESIPDAIADGLEPDSLVCMSSHGRGGLARAVMGSVAEALLRILGRPALIVGPHAHDVTLQGRVIACLDGSPASERTLAPAAAWAALLDQPLWLVEVGEPGPPADWTTAGDAIEAGWLASVARREGIEAWDVLHAHDPADALVDLSASPSSAPAVMVLATHGRTGWTRLHTGSVTLRTVHGSRVPVLVVPAAPEE